MSTLRPGIEPASARGARYECLLRLASGGMATVYVGRLRRNHGFSRLVAIKRAHAHLLEDEASRRGLIAEARIASRLHHPNVVSVLDVEESETELMLVMEYVEGAAFSRLLAAAQKESNPLAIGVTVRVVLDTALGLQSAHALVGEDGEALSIVHRDVSPQNILVGVDGLARIADFGIAKWSESTQATAQGLRGKLAYMAPEYIKARQVDRRGDVFALGVVLWEALSNQRLFRGEAELDTIQLVLTFVPPPPSESNPLVSPALDAVVMRALAKDPEERYATAAEFALALEEAASGMSSPLHHASVAETVSRIVGDELSQRREALRHLDVAPATTTVPEERELVTLTADAPVSVQQQDRESIPQLTSVGARVSQRTITRSALYVGVAVAVAAGALAIHWSTNESSTTGSSASTSRAPEVSSPASLPTAIASTGASPDPLPTQPSSSVTVEPHLQPHPVAVRTTVPRAGASAGPTTSSSASKGHRPGLGY